LQIILRTREPRICAYADMIELYDVPKFRVSSRALRRGTASVTDVLTIGVVECPAGGP